MKKRQAQPRLQVGRMRESEFDALKSMLAVSYGLTAEMWAGWFARVGQENIRVVRKGDVLLGGLGMYRFAHYYGGKSVHTAGIAGVGIAPEHRASGAARAMLIATLKELHRGGTALATLFASTQYLYRSVGFEHAGHAVYYRAPTAGLRPLSVDRSLTVTQVKPTREALEPMYVAAAMARPGHVMRDDAMWSRKLAAQGTDEVFGYLFGPPSAPEGYVIYSQVRHDQMLFDIRARDIVWSTPRAASSILRFFYDQRSMARDVLWLGAPNDPLQLLLSEQVAKVEKLDRFFARVVDVKSALEQRGYQNDGELAFSIDDPVLSENARTWKLRVRQGVGTVAPAARPSVHMTINGLASLMTGMYDAQKLALVGALEGSKAAIAEASQLFAGPVPWIADMF